MDVKLRSHVLLRLEFGFEVVQPVSQLAKFFVFSAWVVRTERVIKEDSSRYLLGVDLGQYKCWPPPITAGVTSCPLIPGLGNNIQWLVLGSQTSETHLSAVMNTWCACVQFLRSK